jgi:RimJ/RimL family protein N-acetyltransferase
MKDIFKGETVRLSATDPDEYGKAFAGWKRDSELMRLMDSGVSRLTSQKETQKIVEKGLEDQKVNQHFFSIRTLTEDKLIGDIGLSVVNWAGGDAFVGIGVCERDFWGKGYGTDAMRVILRYGFTEVNLQRVSLTVFEYNPRAMHCYEKVGFRHEGRQRGFLNREGKRWDMLTMGILREEWLEMKF